MIRKIFILVFLAMAAVACTKEPAGTADASFSIENIENLFAGEAVVFNVTGEADFLTFYPGTETSSFDSIPLHSGIVIRKNQKSFTYTYASQGNYKPAIVASSYGQWSEEEVQDVKFIEIEVSDTRNEITRFYFTDLKIDGTIEENLISFSLPGSVDITNLKASWIITSADAQVFIGDNLQTAGETRNNYTNPVTLRVVAPSGDERLYTVQVAQFPASDENQLLSFGTEDPDRVAVIDEETKEVRLTFPFGTNLRSIKVYGTSSPGSRMKIGPRSVIEKPFANNLTKQPTVLKITAENGDVQEYQIYSSSESPFASYTFSSIVPNPSATIDHDAKTILVKVAPEADITNLVASFTGNEAATTTVGGVTQVSGVTANDFSTPLEYVVTGQDGVPVSYTVTVEVYD